MIFVKNNPGIKLENMEVCLGPGVVAHPESEKVFLFGDCAIKSNKDLDNAIKVKGCPPKIMTYAPALLKNSIGMRKASAQLLKSTMTTIGFKLGIYHQDLGYWESHDSPEFDIGHFK